MAFDTSALSGLNDSLTAMAGALSDEGPVINKALRAGAVPIEEQMLANASSDPKIITGDLPTPIKYANPVIRDNYHDIESQSKNKLLGMLPESLRPVYKDILFFESLDPEYRAIVKAADRLSAYIKCVEECKAGNSEFFRARDSVMDSMRAMKLPELDYFIDNYLPAYSLTLDELENTK